MSSVVAKDRDLQTESVESHLCVVVLDDSEFDRKRMERNEVSQDPLPEMVTGKQEDFVGPARHVVITGGEPMLPRDISELTKLLRAAKFHITIETAGTIDREIACDLISISPKMANSTPTAQHVGSERAGEWAERHDDTRCRIDVVKSLIRDREYQLKFVVAEPEDLDEIESYLDALGCGPLVDAGGRTEAGRDSIDRSRVLLMPEGVDNATLEKREAWLKPACESKGFTYCHRLHIQWYGNRRAT